MNNYEAIRNMTAEQMESFLDQVYLTGLNTGMYAARHEEDEEILDINPFDTTWLMSPAEKATAAVADEEDGYLLDALMESVLRSAGISWEDALRIVRGNDVEEDGSI